MKLLVFIWIEQSGFAERHYITTSRNFGISLFSHWFWRIKYKGSPLLYTLNPVVAHDFEKASGNVGKEAQQFDKAPGK